MSYWNRSLAAMLHTSSMAFMAWGFNNLKTLPIDVSINSEKGGHFQFLTIQGLALAFITSGLSAIVDLFPSFQPAIALRRSLLLISLPLAIVVSSIYWTLLKLFTPLILRSMPVSESAPSHNPHNLPELALIRLPISMDITLHALPAIAMAAEFFIFEKKYSAKAEKYGAPTMAALYGIGYALWVEYCASFNGRFPYPFLDIMLPGRIAVYIGATSIAIFSFKFLNYLHR